MNISDDELAEFLKLRPDASYAEEGGRDYFLLPDLELPEGCDPNKVDALFCASEESGYKCSLFFSVQISTPRKKNWNRANKRILGRTWHGYSFQTPDGLSLIKKYLILYDGIVTAQAG